MASGSGRPCSAGWHFTSHPDLFYGLMASRETRHFDRYPHTFVPSIFHAAPADYQEATQRMFNNRFAGLPVVESAS